MNIQGKPTENHQDPLVNHCFPYFPIPSKTLKESWWSKSTKMLQLKPLTTVLSCFSRCWSPIHVAFPMKDMNVCWGLCRSGSHGRRHAFAYEVAWWLDKKAQGAGDFYFRAWTSLDHSGSCFSGLIVAWISRDLGRLMASPTDLAVPVSATRGKCKRSVCCLLRKAVQALLQNAKQAQPVHNQF